MIKKNFNSPLVTLAARHANVRAPPQNPAVFKRGVRHVARRASARATSDAPHTTHPRPLVNRRAIARRQGAARILLARRSVAARATSRSRATARRRGAAIALHDRSPLRDRSPPRDRLPPPRARSRNHSPSPRNCSPRDRSPRVRSPPPHDNTPEEARPVAAQLVAFALADARPHARPLVTARLRSLDATRLIIV